MNKEKQIEAVEYLLYAVMEEDYELAIEVIDTIKNEVIEILQEQQGLAESGTRELFKPKNNAS